MPGAQVVPSCSSCRSTDRVASTFSAQPRFGSWGSEAACVGAADDDSTLGSGGADGLEVAEEGVVQPEDGPCSEAPRHALNAQAATTARSAALVVRTALRNRGEPSIVKVWWLRAMPR